MASAGEKSLAVGHIPGLDEQTALRFVKYDYYSWSVWYRIRSIFHANMLCNEVQPWLSLWESCHLSD